MKKTLMSLSLLFSLSSLAAVTPSQLRKEGYFTKLDFYEENIAKIIPAFEAKQIGYAEEMLRTNDINPLALAYIAIYMVNTNDGIIQKSLTLKEVMKTTVLSKEGTEEAEHLERQKRIISYLETAHKLAPKDYRIKTWLLGEQIRRGDPTAMDEMIELGASGVTFATAAAALVSREEHLTHEQDSKLLKTVLIMNLKCMFKSADHCIPLKYAPYTMQASMSIMSDFIYKYGISNDVKNLFPRMMPKMMMQLLHKKSMKEKTDNWRFKEDLVDRTAVYKNSMKKENYKMDYHQSAKAARAYQCAACHSPSRDQDSAPVVENYGEHSKYVEQTKSW